MAYVKANGLDLYFETGGEGPRLFFISGSGGDLRNRPNVFDGPLASSFEVLAYDQRGLGQSARPEGPYTMADYADDAAALLDVLGWEPGPVMGVSFGGMVAQELAIRYPEKVTRLVLACTSAGGAGGASYPLHELESLDEQTRAEQHLAISDVRRDAGWRTANPERWARYLEMAMSARRADRDREGARLQLEARSRHDTWDRLPELRMPVLLAGGRFDGIAPPANMEAMASRIPDARLEFFDGGHLFLIQDKSAYPLIIQWLTNGSAP